MKSEEIKQLVKDRYGQIARRESSCCAPEDSCSSARSAAEDLSKKIGYTQEDLTLAPQGANLSLGCGNPVALASLKEGETVLDLGSGAGFDAFLAANKVGAAGKVIGVDMTHEMVEKARRNAKNARYENIEFRLGDIEHLPVSDHSVDVVISNCVINLVPDKGRVFKEAFRVLKPGGSLMISDIVLLKKLPSLIKRSMEAYASCLSGAIAKDQYLATIGEAGFKDVQILEETPFPIECMANDPLAKLIIQNLTPILPKKVMAKLNEVVQSVASIKVRALKPNEITKPELWT